MRRGHGILPCGVHRRRRRITLAKQKTGRRIAPAVLFLEMQDPGFRMTTSYPASCIPLRPTVLSSAREGALMRVLSGVQPSGTLHIGNYFGAIRQFVALQDEHECYYFLADLHALTTVQDAARMRVAGSRTRRRLSRTRARPGAKRHLPPVRLPEIPELDLVSLDGDLHGPAPALPLVQGQGRPGDRAQPRTVRLSGADGGGHPDRAHSIWCR